MGGRWHLDPALAAADHEESLANLGYPVVRGVKDCPVRRVAKSVRRGFQEGQRLLVHLVPKPMYVLKQERGRLSQPQDLQVPVKSRVPNRVVQGSGLVASVEAGLGVRRAWWPACQEVNRPVGQDPREVLLVNILDGGKQEVRLWEVRLVALGT